MRTYLSPIGYNSTSVTRPLLSRGIDTGDTIVLVRPDVEEDSRAIEAIEDVERLIREIEPDIELETERVPHDDFEAAVLQCSDLFRAADGERVVNLGGGARDVLLPFAIAAIVHVQLLDAALFFSDIDGTVEEWSLPRLSASVQESSRTTLRAIVDERDEISIPELTTRSDRSKSTITRHVSNLEAEQLVETKTEGKTKYVWSTLSGQLFLRATR